MLPMIEDRLFTNDVKTITRVPGGPLLALERKHFAVSRQNVRCCHYHVEMIMKKKKIRCRCGIADAYYHQRFLGGWEHEQRTFYMRPVGTFTLLFLHSS